MKRIILGLGVLFAVANMNAQSLTIEAEVIHPTSPEYEVVIAQNMIHAIQGAKVTYNMDVTDLGPVENVVSCQYRYNSEEPVDADYTLENGTLKITSVSFENLSTNTEPNTFSVSVIVKENEKDENTILGAEAMGVRVYDEPSCDLETAPAHGKYMRTPQGSLEWELNANGGGTWNYEWRTSSGQTGNEEKFTMPLSALDEITTVKLVAKNIAPDNTTVWKTYEKEWSFDIYEEASISLDVPVNTSTTPVEFFQNMKWGLSATTKGGFPNGWSFEWKDAETGEVLDLSNIYNLDCNLGNDIVNRHIKLTVTNIVTFDDGETEEWFNGTYNYYATFYPLPVIEFAEIYPDHVKDGYNALMAVTIKDKKGNPINTDTRYNWTYKWNGVAGSSNTYSYSASNPNNYDGVTEDVTLDVIGKLKNGDGQEYKAPTCKHTYKVWPLPNLTLNVPVNTSETAVEFFQNMKWELAITSSGGYKDGWTFEWKDTDTYDVLGRDRKFDFINSETNTIVNRHVKLTVTNAVPFKQGQTEVWFNETYDYYANFYPLPVIEFAETYPANVIDGDVKMMSVTIKDKQDNPIDTDSRYNWMYKWNGLAGSNKTYSYTASNPNNNDGIAEDVTLDVIGKLVNGDGQEYKAPTHKHTYMVWPKPVIEDLSGSGVNKVECGGRSLELQLSTKGGMKTGWSFQWYKDGVDITGATSNTYSKILERGSSESMITENYSVRVMNICDGMTRIDKTYSYPVQLYPEPWTPSDVVIIDENRNIAPTNAIREGNKLSLLCDVCYGGYPGAWTYEWSQNGNVISTDNTSEISVNESFSGESKDNSKKVDLMCVVKNAYTAILWEDKSYTKTYTIYRKPKTPSSLTKKGNGASRTLVATMAINDQQLMENDYYLCFGHRESNGSVTVIGEPQKQEGVGQSRFVSQVPQDLWDDADNLCVFALWHYDDGIWVSSGLRFINAVEEGWDGSDYVGGNVYSGTTRGGDVTTIQNLKMLPEDIQSTYSLDGTIRGSMLRGLNIVRMADGSVHKVIKK